MSKLPTKSESEDPRYISDQFAKELLFDLTVDSVLEEPSDQNAEELLL